MTITHAIPLPRVGGTSARTTVHLAGEIDIFTSNALRQGLMAALLTSTSTLVIDLSGVSFCDTVGLGILVGIQHRARAQGVTLVLAGPRPHMISLLHVSGLDRSLPIAL
ncbi:STAS domain-containing protein [Nonomuraea guangzhouensis]|uniref:STAS domain-containing protein n=1 Tax=Nonomuraea guangzhouensis TaxID=1291555 RepID=A0ABW4GNK4_9ACTN|nr:STAS domain-containing protein [Nonomuraea guangzhouensis]